MIVRDFVKKILVKKLHLELKEWSPKFQGIMSPPDGTSLFYVVLNEELTPQEDIELHKLVMEVHVPSSSFINEKALTDKRNKEGFDLYKKIFAHISDVQPISHIDSFIAVSDVLHKLRNFLKDGNFETAVRHMYKFIRPIMMNEKSIMYGLDFNLYQGWVKDIAIKYDKKMIMLVKDIDPSAIGTPVENMRVIEYIEIAESI